MQALAGLAIAILVATSIAVGLRLLGLHRRSGELPELLLGVMLLLSVGVGYPLKIASIRLDPATAAPLLALSSLAVAVGFTCLLVFTYRVFRPRSRAGRAAAGVGSAILLATGFWDAVASLQGTATAANVLTPQSMIHGATVACAYLWASVESLRYRAILQRRARVGLGDPVVCNRLLLWGLTGVAVTLGIVLNFGAAMAGVSMVESPLVLLGSSVTGVCQTGLLLLAFAPPRAYLSWVRGAMATQPA